MIDDCVSRVSHLFFKSLKHFTFLALHLQIFWLLGDCLFALCPNWTSTDASRKTFVYKRCGWAMGAFI